MKQKKEQKKIDGIPVHQLYDLRGTITQYILPRLKAFKKMKRMGYPGGLTEEKWEAILDEMIVGLELCHKDDKGELNNLKDIRRASKGWKLFAKWFGDLWD